MYHFLLPVDRDEDRTAAQADFLVDLPVDPTELSVTMLYILPRADAPTGDQAGFEGNESAVRAANRLEGYGMAVARQVRTGESVATAILAEAERTGADQIVMAGRKRSDVAKAVLGSTTSAVVRQSTRPVVLVE